MKCCGSRLAAILSSAVAVIPSLGGNSISFSDNEKFHGHRIL